MARVGVWTRPTGVLLKPPDLLLKAVIARVPLMPTSQSASARQREASESGRRSVSVLQPGEAFADGGRRHRLEPEPLDGMLAPVMGDDVAEDEFALAPGVAGVDEAVHVLAFDEFDQRLEPVLALLDGGEREMGREVREGVERPFPR
jgi:hypothetical protein